MSSAIFCGLSILVLVVSLTARVEAQSVQEPVDVERLAFADAEAGLAATDEAIARVRAEADGIAAEIAAFDRSPSLGPVQRAQYSRMKQRAAELADGLAALQRRRSSFVETRSESARRLLELLEPAIARARAAYTGAPRDSQEQLVLFQRYELLVRERQRAQALLSPTPSLIRLDVTMDADDTADSLATKADILADVIGSYEDLVRVAWTWMDALRSEREIVAEALRLREENEFFRSVDPLDPGPTFPDRDIARSISVPPSLEWARPQLAIPEGGLRGLRDLDDLLRSIEELRGGLLEEASRLHDKRLIIQAEAERRRGLE